MELRNIYENKCKIKADQKIIEWIENTNKLQIEQFYTANNSINYNKKNILDFFNNRSTNASA